MFLSESLSESQYSSLESKLKILKKLRVNAKTELYEFPEILWSKKNITRIKLILREINIKTQHKLNKLSKSTISLSNPFSLTFVKDWEGPSKPQTCNWENASQVTHVQPVANLSHHHNIKSWTQDYFFK